MMAQAPRLPASHISPNKSAFTLHLSVSPLPHQARWLVTAVYTCPWLVQGFKKSGSTVFIRLRHTLSFSSLSISHSASVSVHVECLPGSIKGTGRQRSPSSKHLFWLNLATPFIYALFLALSLSFSLTHSLTRTRARRLAKRGRTVAKKPSWRVRAGHTAEEAEAKMDVRMMGLRWSKASDGLVGVMKERTVDRDV